MALNREVVNQVKERADIVQVVGERVALSPSGDGYMGLCPFHPEKTPSFRVSPSRRMFHCFGCSAGGSVIDFVMHSENMEFGEAVESLAARFGVALPSRGQTAAGDRAVEVLEAARKYYSGLLLSSPLAEGARSYLSGRDFSRTGWEAFSLGFAPEGWQNFCDHARRLGFSESDLLASGLARRGKSGSLYDMLRKRVVFPILNEQGRPIAFGGRIIDPADQPKYLNTPETRLYQKSRVLFGFSLGREQFRKTRRALLTEGYLDVIRLHEHGFTEAVATCGTALSADHLKLLERHVRSAVLVFDGDDAGIKAALRSAPLFLERGLEARVCLLPDGQDPDDFLRKNGPQAFQALLEESGPLLEFL
ncbi:MAG: DNA primase, partial [Deltaproteobacteria bacterium]|nr:DNA primase [Deltaproteobacteria bacterium]